jgi:hypothetical protein
MILLSHLLLSLFYQQPLISFVFWCPSCRIIGQNVEGTLYSSPSLLGELLSCVPSPNLAKLCK